MSNFERGVTRAGGVRSQARADADTVTVPPKAGRLAPTDMFRDPGISVSDVNGFTAAVVMHMRNRIHIEAQEMAVAVRVLLVALLGLYWSSSHIEGNRRELHLHTTVSYFTHVHMRIHASPFVLHKSMLVDLCYV